MTTNSNTSTATPIVSIPATPATPITAKTKSGDGRGRKKGGVSFMQVTLAELNRILQPDARVIVSLRYASLIGLEGKAVGADMSVMEYCVNSGKVDAQMESFNEGVNDGNDGNDGPEEPATPRDLGKRHEESDDDDFQPQLQADLVSWDD